MRTVQELNEFIVTKQYLNRNISFDYSVALQEIVQVLNAAENVVFICATSDFISGAFTYKNGAVAVTNERLIYSVKENRMFFKNPVTKSISLEFVSDVRKSHTKPYPFGNIWIDTLNDKFNFCAPMEQLDEMYNEILAAIKKSGEKDVNANNLSSADEIKKFKDLLDSGVITQEEFDAKKKQLLGL